MSRMRASVKSLQRPRAAETVVDDILNVLDKLKRQGSQLREMTLRVPLVATGSHLCRSGCRRRTARLNCE